MDIAQTAGVATQLAQQKTTFIQSQIKQNAQNEREVADILQQSADAGAAAASKGGVNIVV